MRRALLVLLSLTVCLVALAAPVLLPRSEAPPTLRGESGYVINREAAVFEGSRTEVLAFLRSPAGNILDFTTPTDRIPQITETVVLSGDFPEEVDAVRRIFFDGGDEVVERVLAYSDDRFSYQVWGFTAAAALPLSHIRGTFQYNEIEENRTEVIWEYAIAPRVFWARPFIRGFLRDDFAPFMESGLQGAASAFNATRG